MRRSRHSFGLDVLSGDMGTGGAPSVSEEYGPVSPAQLAQLNRKLTAAEQKAVDDWQASQSVAMQAAEEAKPFINPKTGKKTVIRTTYEPAVESKSAWPWWKILLAVGGTLVAGGTGWALLRRRK